MVSREASWTAAVPCRFDLLLGSAVARQIEQAIGTNPAASIGCNRSATFQTRSHCIHEHETGLAINAGDWWFTMNPMIPLLPEPNRCGIQEPGARISAGSPIVRAPSLKRFA
jgi:hypothetical protein